MQGAAVVRGDRTGADVFTAEGEKFRRNISAPLKTKAIETKHSESRPGSAI